MKKPVLKYKTIVLSDVHLGTNDCKAEEVNFFLKHTRCDKLILNGDIIDGWSLKRKLNWKKSHTWFIRRILKIAEKRKSEVIYVRGNHDDFLAGYLPLMFDRLQIVEEHIHHGEKGDYLVVHGDCFDAVTTHSKFVSILGDVGYQQLLRINRLYNKWRAFRGKEYYSLSKAIKAKVKQAVSHISDFEDHLQALASKRGCMGIICGHIHTPEDKMIGDTHYLNSGDWVESLTALVEDKDGNWEVLDYGEFCIRLHEKAELEQRKTPLPPVRDGEEIKVAKEDTNVIWLDELDEEELAAPHA
ncbi:UDP-2,3-diacylglucosamine diphosphatase [Cerasicoccus fimbriatus]|uniref:UDP-2,3-diacylglucosamine diphosphatase n=1 Tax=Cerasicoccus fimbriatus TaxID=3014554 RepID=UPI0022B5A2BE|nr:UDP-2,3-diacylglucosamine diphosphatase [Cerasicoccus sp. TK19100]